MPERNKQNLVGVKETIQVMSFHQRIPKSKALKVKTIYLVA